MGSPQPTLFTILVIDDDPQMLETTTELLAAEGHRVLKASSGEDGLTLARSDRLDLILVDYHMPVMNGREVVERLKADAATRRIPVVALTSGRPSTRTSSAGPGASASSRSPSSRQSFSASSPSS